MLRYLIAWWSQHYAIGVELVFFNRIADYIGFRNTYHLLRFDLISTCIESWLLQKAETNKRLRQMASVANLRTGLKGLHLFCSIFSHICIEIYAIKLLLLLLVASVANGICMGVSAVI